MVAVCKQDHPILLINTDILYWGTRHSGLTKTCKTGRKQSYWKWLAFALWWISLIM